MVYRKRIYHDGHKAEMLAALKDCRDACIRTTIAAPISGDVYQGAEGVMAAIDAMAEVLTGDRTHFHLKAHSTHNEPAARDKAAR